MASHHRPNPTFTGRSVERRYGPTRPPEPPKKPPSGGQGLFAAVMLTSLGFFFLASDLSPIPFSPQVDLFFMLCGAGLAAPVFAGPITNIVLELQGGVKAVLFTGVCMAVLAGSMELADLYLTPTGGSAWSPTNGPKATSIDPMIPAVVGVAITWAAIVVGGTRGLFVIGLLAMPAATGFVIRGLAHPQYGNVAGFAGGVAIVILMFAIWFSTGHKRANER